MKCYGLLHIIDSYRLFSRLSMWLLMVLGAWCSPRTRVCAKMLMVTQDVRFGIWIDRERMRAQDLAVARDLRKLGVSVMLIGHGLPNDPGDLVFQLPAVPRDWQFLIDIIPAQLAAERLAQLSGVDCDSFRYCSFIVEDEYGLLSEEAGTLEDKEWLRNLGLLVNKAK
jgi:hypothetical protein